eukprot:gb/GEZJ01005195.1/.p1 GENE.gb/GEZJ01005195.1/~~gb/GEZJ01005195.1/.p1  ORF type:complete len:186 (+),score=14.28 gb/GEZJ01005195.1/:159-716(+)
MSNTALSDDSSSTATTTQSTLMAFDGPLHFRYRRPANKKSTGRIKSQSAKDVTFRTKHSTFGLFCNLLTPDETELYSHRIHLTHVSIHSSTTHRVLLSWKVSGMRKKQCFVWSGSCSNGEPVYEIVGFLQDTYRIVERATGITIMTVRRKVPSSRNPAYNIRMSKSVQVSLFLFLAVSIDSVHNW